MRLKTWLVPAIAIVCFGLVVLALMPFAANTHFTLAFPVAGVGDAIIPMAVPA